MQTVIDFVLQPWPWYVAGPLIGLTVPALLLIGNKSFGISSSLRHLCAVCVPAKVPFFQYNWEKEMWNLFFVAGVFVGGFAGAFLLGNPDTILISEATIADLSALGLTEFNSLMPLEIFRWGNLTEMRGGVFFILGGFLVGFGTRYAGGCTSGHAIMGISNLQWPSVVATCCFMAGGFAMTHLILPHLLSWLI